MTLHPVIFRSVNNGETTKDTTVTKIAVVNIKMLQSVCFLNRDDPTSKAESSGHRSRPFRYTKTHQRLSTTRTSRQAHSRPCGVSDARIDEWPDITKVPYDQNEPSASCWAGPIPQGSSQISIQKTSESGESHCGDEVGLI